MGHVVQEDHQRLVTINIEFQVEVYEGAVLRKNLALCGMKSECNVVINWADLATEEATLVAIKNATLKLYLSGKGVF